MEDHHDDDLVITDGEDFGGETPPRRSAAADTTGGDIDIGATPADSTHTDWTPGHEGAPDPVTPAAQVEGQERDVFAIARENGFTDEYLSRYSTPEHFLGDLFDALYAEQEAASQWQQRYEAAIAQVEAREAEERRKQEEAEKAPQEPWWPELPEYHPHWHNMIEYRDGRPVSVAGADPTIPQKIVAYQEALRDRLHRLASNPLEAIKPGLEPYLREFVEPMIQQAIGALHEQVETARYIDQNLPRWKGQDGQYTEEGMRFLGTYRLLREALPNVPGGTLRHLAESLSAMQSRGTQQAAAQPAAPAAPQQPVNQTPAPSPAIDRRTAALRRGNRAPSTVQAARAVAGANHNESRLVPVHEIVERTFRS